MCPYKKSWEFHVCACENGPRYTLKHVLGFVGDDRLCDWQEVLVSIAGPLVYDGKPAPDLFVLAVDHPAYSSFRLCSRFLSIASEVNTRHTCEQDILTRAGMIRPRPTKGSDVHNNPTSCVPFYGLVC